MKAAEAHKLTDPELAQKLKELRTELFRLRFQSVTGQLENPMRIRQVRHDIARVQTVMRERELGIEA